MFVALIDSFVETPFPVAMMMIVMFAGGARW
jgi:hypothetical protein